MEWDTRCNIVAARNAPVSIAHYLFIISFLLAIARITINVLDQNDNFPIFASSLYRGKVALDANVGTSVIQVRASDLDSSSNGEIEYSLIQGNEEEGFQINNQGVISVKKPLTTVEKEKFKIRVQASDKGEVPKKGYANVEIIIFLPDGPPKFVVSPVIVNVTEGVPANSRVAGVKAATSEALTYTIIGGNADGMFTINPSTGEVSAGISGVTRSTLLLWDTNSLTSRTDLV